MKLEEIVSVSRDKTPEENHWLLMQYDGFCLDFTQYYLWDILAYLGFPSPNFVSRNILVFDLDQIVAGYDSIVGPLNKVDYAIYAACGILAYDLVFGENEVDARMREAIINAAYGGQN